MGNNIALNGLRKSLQEGRIWLIISLVWAMSFFPGIGQLEAYGQTKSTKVVRSELAKFYEVYLSRKLSQQELDQVTKQFIEHFGASTCKAKCVQALDSHNANMTIFKNKRGQPEELVIRHAYISQNYFSPKMRGTLIQRLLAEPDPIRVVNPVTQRLMTEKDVIALANLELFRQSNGAPKHQSFSQKEIDEAVSVLEPLVGSQPKAKKMPIMFVTAAELWAGIQRNWSSLSASEQQSVRDYIQYKSDKPIPVHLYSRLSGLPVNQAQIVQNYEQLDGTKNIVSSYLDLMSRYGYLRYMPYGTSF